MKTLILSCFSLVTLFGQDVRNDAFNQELKRLLSLSVPTISVDEAFEKKDSFTFLDSRELNEYRVSHIPNAQYVGYNTFDTSIMKNIPKDEPIIVYCSVGYRSEKISEKLIDAGYTNVFNLYGSIFEWTNCGLPITNGQGQPTDTLHTFNRSWSQWVDAPKIVKWW